jgi:bifunctional non-homologous end joining protein LigD
MTCHPPVHLPPDAIRLDYPMLPRVKPIAPVRRTEPFDDPEWVFDLKYDGFRALCYLDQGRRVEHASSTRCCLISRNGNLMSRFARLSDQIAASLDVSDAILDGEVIAADKTGRPQFYDLLRQRRAPTYVAFDLLWPNGVDLRPLPLIERRRHLQNILTEESAIIFEALSVTGTGCKLFELMCAHNLEGVVAKRLKDPYGSRARWLKIKNPSYSQNEGRRLASLCSRELFDRSSSAYRREGSQNWLGGTFRED